MRVFVTAMNSCSAPALGLGQGQYWAVGGGGAAELSRTAVSSGPRICESQTLALSLQLCDLSADKQGYAEIWTKQEIVFSSYQADSSWFPGRSHPSSLHPLPGRCSRPSQPPCLHCSLPARVTQSQPIHLPRL